MRAGGRSVPRLGLLPTPHGARPNQGTPFWAAMCNPERDAQEGVQALYSAVTQLVRPCLAWPAMQLCNVGIMKEEYCLSLLLDTSTS